MSGPITPVARITAATAIGEIQVEIVNPPPAGSDPSTVSNDLYRSTTGTGTGERVAVGLAPNATFIDVTFTSRTAYYYRVLAHGSDGSSTSSDWAGAEVARFDAGRFDTDAYA